MAAVANRLRRRFRLDWKRGRSGAGLLPRMRHICRASLTVGRPFARCVRGNAAIEFGLLAPVLLLILAAVTDIGLVLRARFVLNTEVSSAVNYSVMRGGNVTDAGGAADFAELIAGQLRSGGVETASVVFNKAASATLAGDEVTRTSGPGNVASCYCPKNPPEGATEWGSVVDCSVQCPNGTTAARYLEMTASTSHSSLFEGFAFGGDAVSVHAMVRID